MKLRWKEHEIIFVSILAAVSIISTIININKITNGFMIKFQEHNLYYSSWTNALLPQISTVVIFYLAYLSVNMVIIPQMKKISFSDFERMISLKILLPTGIIVVTAFFLALVANIISYYARPYLFNYAQYQLLAMFGYHDEPLSDLFFGFGRAILLVLIWVALTGVREFICWLISRPSPQREFRVMVVNNITPLIFLWIMIPVLWNPLHRDFMDYISWTLPVISLYIYQTFWLFPLKTSASWKSKPILARLLIATFLGTFLSALFFGGGEKLMHFLLYWMFLLFIVTPLSWILYQQRRDRILQLKNMEIELATTNTELQFLRSQINPHFLFNALNTLYGTAIKEKSEQTAEGIQMLGDMMRFMLEENHRDFISMNKEIEYLKNYISLQKLRLPDNANIEIRDNIEEVNCRQQIAPMLLIPFVENAFKHGISFQEQSWIDIKLECNESFIVFEVKNSMPSVVENDIEKNNAGIGLKNVADRLKLLYRDKHDLTIHKKENEYIATLVIR